MDHRDGCVMAAQAADVFGVRASGFPSPAASLRQRQRLPFALQLDRIRLLFDSHTPRYFSGELAPASSPTCHSQVTQYRGELRLSYQA